MSGSSVIGYIFEGSDGSRHSFDRDKTLYLIGRGQIENMRAQSVSDGSVIIRGKGTNLNNLPVIDAKELKARLKVIRKVTNNSRVVAYDVVDRNGKIKTLGLKDTVKACKEGLISNIEIHKESNGYRVTWVGFDIKSLESREECTNGTANRNKELTLLKATRVKESGVIVNNNTGKESSISNGDIILIDELGRAVVIVYDKFIRNFKKSDKALNIESNTNYKMIVNGRSVEMKSYDINKWVTVEKVVS